MDKLEGLHSTCNGAGRPKGGIVDMRLNRTGRKTDERDQPGFLVGAFVEAPLQQYNLALIPGQCSRKAFPLMMTSMGNSARLKASRSKQILVP